MKKPPITATSFSRYKLHATCPRAAKYKFVDKLPEPSSPAMARGNDIHVGIKSYLDGRARNLPKDDTTNYGPLALLYKALRKQAPATELELAVDRQWRPVEWFDRSTYIRVKLDAAALDAPARTLNLYDHKTGRERAEEHAEQLETYVAIAPARWPLTEYDSVVARMLYTDQAKPTVALFTQLPRTVAQLRKKWEKKFAPLLKDTTFRATPGDHCRWCAYSGRHKKGPCEAG